MKINNLKLNLRRRSLSSKAMQAYILGIAKAASLCFYFHGRHF